MIFSVPRPTGAVIPDLVLSYPLPSEVLVAVLIFAIVSGAWLVWRALGTTVALGSVPSGSRRMPDRIPLGRARARDPRRRSPVRRRLRADPNRGRAFLR